MPGPESKGQAPDTHANRQDNTEGTTASGLEGFTATSTRKGTCTHTYSSVPEKPICWPLSVLPSEAPTTNIGHLCLEKPNKTQPRSLNCLPVFLPASPPPHQQKYKLGQRGCPPARRSKSGWASSGARAAPVVPSPHGDPGPTLLPLFRKGSRPWELGFQWMHTGCARR